MEALIRNILSDPGTALLAALLGLCLIMMIPVIAAIRRKARERERETDRDARRPVRRPVESREPREPRLGGPSLAYLDDADDDDDDLRGRFANGPRRGRPLPVAGITKVVWFGLGVAVGAAGMALGGGMFGLSDAFRMPIGLGPQESAEAPAPAAAAKGNGGGSAATPAGEQDPVRAAEEALASLPAEEGTVEARMAKFVAGLRDQLPMPIGREINLVRINSRDRIITLAFSIQRTVAEADFAALQRTLEERFKAGICGENDALGIRALNDSGVSFRVVYSEIVGKTVARLEVPPRFCPKSG